MTVRIKPFQEAIRHKRVASGSFKTPPCRAITLIKSHPSARTIKPVLVPKRPFPCVRAWRAKFGLVDAAKNFPSSRRFSLWPRFRLPQRKTARSKRYCTRHCITARSENTESESQPARFNYAKSEELTAPTSAQPALSSQTWLHRFRFSLRSHVACWQQLALKSSYTHICDVNRETRDNWASHMISFSDLSRLDKWADAVKLNLWAAAHK